MIYFRKNYWYPSLRSLSVSAFPELVTTQVLCRVARVFGSRELPEMITPPSCGSPDWEVLMYGWSWGLWGTSCSRKKSLDLSVPRPVNSRTLLQTWGLTGVRTCEPWGRPRRVSGVAANALAAPCHWWAPQSLYAPETPSGNLCSWSWLSWPTTPASSRPSVNGRAVQKSTCKGPRGQPSSTKGAC